MSFYQALQYDPALLKNKIKEATEKKEKRFYISALVIRDILLVAFAIIFIGILSTLFGSENSAMAVVIFCSLLSIRFVDFGYHVKHSLLALGIVFTILAISPVWMQILPPILALLLNFISIMIILVLTCEKPEMGNAGLYMFGYIFLTGAMPSTSVWIQRIFMTMVGYLLCAIVYYRNHRDKNKDIAVHHVVKKFAIHSEKGQWQLQIACTLSILLFFGQYLSMQRFMWVGFACSSLLSAYPIQVHDRFLQRAVGAMIGSLLFGILYCITPPPLLPLYGPISGLCLGLCTSYRSKTIFNCFGGLLVASSVYGIQGAVSLRILNNLFGLLFGYLFFHLFQIVFRYLYQYHHKVKEDATV